MDFQLLPIEKTDLPIFKHDMQEAFQLGAATWEDDLDEEKHPGRYDTSLATNSCV